MPPTHAPRVLILHSCANFYFLTHFIKDFCLFCAILGIFANFARFWAFFCIFWAYFEQILCANFAASKFWVCYFVSFFHLCYCLYSSISILSRSVTHWVLKPSTYPTCSHIQKKNWLALFCFRLIKQSQDVPGLRVWIMQRVGKEKQTVF